MSPGKFPLGRTVWTRGVVNKVAESQDFAKFVVLSLRRHVLGDWGDLGPEDKAANDEALQAGDLRILSAYERQGLPKVWIITEADRSVTAILFPEEY